MMKTMQILGLAIGVMLLGTGCSTPRNSDSAALQGAWKGEELGGHTNAPCYLVVSKKNFEFRGADANDWYKGTFSLREETTPKQLIGVVTQCPSHNYVGKTTWGIYQIANGALTFAVHEPGNAEPPSSFDAPDARRFAFKRE
jgi:uncharacterized protein (TIGR03067 family)